MMNLVHMIYMYVYKDSVYNEVRNKVLSEDIFYFPLKEKEIIRKNNVPH